MRVSTNVKSMVAQRYVKNHVEEHALEDSKLSSGDRIVRAAVDPAGLAIAERMRSKIRSNSQAERNTNDSISLLQVAEGSLENMQSMGIRLRELAVQAASDTVSDMDRIIVDKEFQQLKNEIERVTLSTRFNGNSVINGKSSQYDLQVGTGGDAELDRVRYDLNKVLDSKNNFGIRNIDLRSKSGAQSSLGAIDKMMSSISSSRAELGSMGTRMNAIIQNLQIYRENMSSSHSKIRDADIAKESAIKASVVIKEGAGMEMLKQANNQPNVILSLLS